MIDQFPHTTPVTHTHQQPDDVGPLILTTRAQTWGTALLALPILLVIAPLFLLFFVPYVSIEIKLFVLTPLLIVWILITGFGAVGLLTHLDFHLHAVNVRRGAFIVRTIPYADCSSFTFAVVKSHFHGIPLPSVLIFSLRYRPLRGISFQRLPGRPKPWSSSLPPTSELDPARDVIAAGMAKRMLDQLKQGTPLKWTRSITLHQHELVYKPIIGRSYTIAYSDMRLQTRGLGLFITTTKNNHDETAIALDEANGWPGYVLLLQLIDQAQ